MRVKILTLNIWQGGLLFDQVLEFIRREQPDVLCLQEVFDGHDPALPRNYRTMEVLHQELTDYFSSFAPEFLCRTEHGKIELGNAIFSRFPIVQESAEILNYPYGEYDENPGNFDWSKDPKNIQHCQVQVNGEMLNIFNLHGVWDFHGDDTPARLKMSRIVLDQVKNKPHVFLTGDFNVQPQTETIRMIEAQLDNVFGDTRQTSFNLKHKNLEKSPGYATAVVDFVFVSNDITVLSASCPDADISDHLPLLCEVVLNQPD